MAHDVKIRFRSYLPGGGFDSAGAPKQGKMRVIGEVDVTSYEGGSGEPFGPEAVGLTAIDSMKLRVADENTGDLSHATGAGLAPMRDVSYTKSTGHFYLYKRNDEDWGVYASGDTETLEFEAFGDSAHDVELV